MAATPGYLGTQPFFFQGGPAACLLIHGFTGTPDEMLYLGKKLNSRGMTVSGIQLAGHGTTAREMLPTGRADWYKSAEDELLRLHEKFSEVHIAGLSMGGALTLMLCAKQPDKIRSAATLAAAAIFKDWKIRLSGPASHIIKFFPAPKTCDLTDKYANNTIKSYDTVPLRCAAQLYNLTLDVQRALPSIKTPLLIMHGSNDKTLWPGNAQFIHSRAASAEKQLIMLKNSGHGVTVDVEKDLVAKSVFNHFAAHSEVLGN